MDANRPPTPGEPGVSFSRAGLFGLSLLFLIFIWHRNYNVLGGMHDYSVVTSAGGHLHHGLLPYRDFTTPLQSLTIYLCYGAELVFGHRYLALSYGNLVVGLVFYLAIFQLLPRELAFPLRVLTAAAVLVCTLFQHGIIWYNPVAMALLVVITLYVARLFRQDQISPGQIARLCGLFFISSMGKLNFHMLGLGLVALTLGLWCWAHRPRPLAVVLAAGFMAFCGVVLGPVTEIILNRTTPAVFFHNVVVEPSKRKSHLLGLIDPNLFLGNARMGMPDNWSSGVFLFGFLIYGGCWYWAFCAGKRETTSEAMGTLRPITCGISILLPVVFVSSMLLAATNDETQMLTASFLLVGWVFVFALLRPYLAAWQQEIMTFGVCLLGGFFFVAGSSSAFMHSRVRLFETSWSNLLMDSLYNQRSLAALKHVVPLYDAHEVLHGQGNYLDGVQLTEAARKPLEKVASFMERTHAGKSADDIFWGPDCMLVGRVYDSRLKTPMPLWYDRNVTVHPSDSPWIIESLKTANYEWIVNTLEVDLPPAVIAWMNANYECVERDDIIVYHLIPPSRPGASGH